MDDRSKDSTPTETSDHSRTRVLAAFLYAHHTTFYTVVSVIQATCFGFLVLVAFEEGTHYGLSQWLLTANTLAIIVLVWNGFVRGFIVLSYVPKLVDGVMPFALGAAQCFAAYFAGHDAHNWHWSIAALSLIGCVGYINAEVNARINPKENSHIMVFMVGNCGYYRSLLSVWLLFAEGSRIQPAGLMRSLRCFHSHSLLSTRWETRYFGFS